MQEQGALLEGVYDLRVLRMVPAVPKGGGVQPCLYPVVAYVLVKGAQHAL